MPNFTPPSPDSVIDEAGTSFRPPPPIAVDDQPSSRRLSQFTPPAPVPVDEPVTESMRPVPNRRLSQFSSPLSQQVSAWSNPEPEQPKPDNSEAIKQVQQQYSRDVFDTARETARNSGDWTPYEQLKADYKAKMAAAGAPVLEEPGIGEVLNTPIAQFEKYTPSVQTAQDAFEYLRKGITHPFSQTVDISGPSEKPGKAAQATAGALRAVAKTGDFFTSPLGIATAGSGALPEAIQKLISFGFTLDMLSSTPELAKRFGEATVTGDTEQQVETLGDLLLNSAMAGEGVKHAVTPAKINLSRALAKELLHSKVEAEPVPEGTPGSPLVRNVDNLPPDGDVGAQLNTEPAAVTAPNQGQRVPIKVVSPIEDNGSVNTPNLMEIAHDMRDRFEQIGLHGALSPQQKAMLSVLRPMLDNPQPNQTENLARFFGLKLDEAATDMPERYRYVTVSGLSKPQPQGTKAPAPTIPFPETKGANGETIASESGTKVLPAATTSDILGANATPASASSAAERPQPVAAATAPEKAAPSGEPIVLNGRAFSKIGDKWYDATSGKQREVKKPGVVSQLDAIAESQAAAAAHPSTYDVGEEPTAGAPGKTDVPPLPGASEVPRNTRVIDPATGYPVEDTDVDPKTLKLSADVPNFKSGAGDTGEVQGSELTGKYTRVGTGRTVVWERKDGTREVITGRHRWQLALRSGVKDFPVQILREADGFGRENALVLDAESNIRDNQGSVKDYAHFFRSTPYDEQTAASRGLFREGSNAKGRDGFNIGKYAGDNLYALFMGDKIPERQASAIAKSAPNDENLQRVGVNAALSGANIGESVARIEAAKAAADASGKPKQFDFFADTSLEETWKKQGDYVAAERKRLQDIISTRRAIVSKPEAAMSTGSIRATKRGGKGGYTAQQELERWQNWATDPDLSAKVKAASSGEQVPAATDKNGITTAKERPTNVPPEGEQLAKKPIIVYRAIPKGSEAFNKSDIDYGTSGIGFHFGTKLAADTIASEHKKGGYAVTVKPYELDIKNPIRLTDRGAWFADDIAKGLQQRGVISDAEAERVGDNAGRLVRLLKSKGYDGAVYENAVEDKGNDSYIAFSKDQIKPHIERSEDTGTGDMFGANVAMKTPEQLAEEKRLDDQRLAIAAKQNKHLTGALDTTMVLPGTEGAAGEGDIPLLTQPKPKGALPDFASRFDRNTLLQVPDWASPSLHAALLRLSTAREPLIGADVTADWNRLTPAQRQELAARGFVTTSTRNPGQVEIHVSQDATAAARYFRANGALATEPPQELAKHPPLNARGLKEIRDMVNSADSQLPQRVKDVVNAMLDTPVMRKLDWNKLTVFLTDRLEGPSGEFSGLATIESDLIELSRAANADTFPHEVFHFLYEMLPDKYRSAIGDMRAEAIERSLKTKDLSDAERGFLTTLQSGDALNSEQFSRDTIRHDFYNLINDSEFLASMAGRKFATDAFNSRNQTFVQALRDRVIDWTHAIVDAVKRVIGMRPDMEQIFRELLSGRHMDRMAASIEDAATRHGSFMPDAKRAREARLLAKNQDERHAQAKDALGQSVDIMDLLEKHGAGTAQRRAQSHLNYYDYAGIQNEGVQLNNGVKEGYRAVKARMTDPWKRAGFSRIVNQKYERFDVDLKNTIAEHDKAAQNLQKPGMLRLINRDSVAKAAADSAQTMLTNSKAIFDSAIAQVRRVLKHEAKSDRDTARLEGELREVINASESSSAMQQLLPDMVNVLSSTHEGLQMLSDPNVGTRTAMLKLYRELKAATGQPLHGESLLRWAAYVLERNKEVRDELLAQQMNSNSAIRVAMNAYEHKLLADMESNPEKTIRGLLRERTKLVTDADKAGFAWRTIHKKLLDKLADYDALDEAATVARNILADPDYNSLRREIAKDAGTKGVNLGGKAPALASGFSKSTIVLPDMTEFELDPADLVGGKTQWQQVRQKYEAAEKVYENYFANQANLDDPNYLLHKQHHEEITSVYLAHGIMQPSDKNFVFKRSFNVIQQAVRLAGGRVAAGAKKAVGDLAWTKRLSGEWSQSASHRVALAIIDAVKSHADDLPKDSLTNQASEWYRRHFNELLDSHNQQTGALQAGDVTGAGWKVTGPDMAAVRLQSSLGSRAYEILGHDQSTVDTLGGVTVIRSSIKGTENMTVRGFTTDTDLKTFLTEFAKAHDAKDEQGMLKALDQSWRRVGYSFLQDRRPDFAEPTLFDGPTGAFKVLAERMRNNPAAIPDTSTLFRELSALSTLTPDESKAVILKEFGRILTDLHREIVADDTQQAVPRAVESKNSFTRSRNEVLGPFAFYDNGFRTSGSVQRFGMGMMSRAFDRMGTALEAVEKDIQRQRDEFQTQIEQRMAQGLSRSKAQNQVQSRNAAERRNGETYDNFKSLQTRLKNIHDVRALLQNVTDISDDMKLSRYVGDLQGLLIGTIATFRNIGRAPIKLGQMAMRLGNNPITAGVLAGYYGYADTGARMLSSLGLSLMKSAYLIPKGIVLTAAERKHFGEWWGSAMRPFAEELGTTMYQRVKAVRDAQARGEMKLPDFTAQWDATFAGLLMSQGRLLHEDVSWREKAANYPAALAEKYVLSLQRILMPMFGDTWANIAVNSIAESRFGPFRLWEESLRRIQSDWKGKARFNFNDLTDPVNAISAAEMFNRRPDAFAQRSMDTLRNVFADTGLDFDRKAMEYIREVENGNKSAQFLSDVERSKIKASQIDWTNRASLVNEPLHFQKRDPLTTLIKPFMQWPTRMAAHAVDALSIPSKLTAPAFTPMQILKGRSFQVSALLATIGLTLLWNMAVAPADEEAGRAIKKVMFNQITGFQQPWERSNPAQGWAIYSMASVPALEAISSLMLSDRASRGSLDPTLVMMEKAKDAFRYMGGVMQTGDWTYRLPELLGGFFPDAKVVLNRLESQEGKREMNNIVALARRHGDADLLRPSSVGGSGGIVATPLSPYADKMVAAAMQGNTGEVKRIYDEAVQVARDMGKAKPEEAVKQMFESRNPYTRAFRAELSPEQRQDFLSKLSPAEQAQVQDAEQRFAAGASAIGANAVFQKTPREIASGSRTGASVSASEGAQAPSGGGSVGGGSLRSGTRSPRLSAIGSPARGTGIRRVSGLRRPRLSGAGARGGSIKRIRGPRLSRFA